MVWCERACQMLQQAIFHKCAATGGIFFAENQPAHSWENLRTVTCFFFKKKWQFFGVLLVRDFEFVTRAWTDTHTHMQACTRSERKTNACARTCSPSLLHTQTLLQIKTHPLPRPCAYNFLDILSICGARSLSLLLFLFLRPFFTMFFSPSLLLSPSLASSHTGWSVGWILHVLCNRYDSKLTWQLRNCIYCRCPICPNPEA